MGRTALRPLYLDVVAASTSLQRIQDHVPEIALVPWWYCKTPVMAPIDSTTKEMNPTRLPSMRPLESRWRCSRAIVLGKQRSVLRDHRWSRSEPFLYGAVSGSRRGFAARPGIVGARAPPLRKQTPPVFTNTDEGDLMNNPHVGRERVVRQVRELQEEIQRLEKDRDSRLAAKDAANAQAIARERQKLEKDRVLYAGVSEGKRSLNAQQAAFQLEVSRFAREKSRLDVEKQAIQSTMAKGFDDARTQANAEVEEMKEALDTEMKTIQQITFRREEQLREYDAAGKEMLAEASRKIDEQSRIHEENAERLYKRERQRALEDALTREQRHRSDYEEYRDLWGILRRFVRPLEFSEIPIRLRKKYVSLASTESHFVIDKSGKPHKDYPRLNDRLSRYYESRQALAQSDVRACDLGFGQVREAMSDLSRSAHAHRSLTRYHRFMPAPSEFDTTKAFHDYMNRDFNSMRLDKDHEINDTKATLAASNSAAEQEALGTKLKTLRLENKTASSVLAYANSVKYVQALKALRHESPVEKALFFETGTTRALVMETKDGIYAVERASPKHPHLNKLRTDYRTILDGLTEFELSFRKLHLLQICLGQSTLDEQSSDRKIDNKIKVQSQNTAKLLQIASGLRGYFEKHTAVTHRERMAADHEKRRQPNSTVQERIKKLELRLADLKAETKTRPSGTEVRKELVRERKRVSLLLQEHLLQYHHLKRSHAGSVERRRLDVHIRELQVSIAKSLRKNEAKIYKDLEPQSEDAKTTEAETNKESNHSSEATIQPPQPSNGGQEAAKTHRSRRNRKLRIRNYISEDRPSSTAVPAPPKGKTLVSPSDQPRTDQGTEGEQQSKAERLDTRTFRILNLQPTKPRQTVSVFMARLYHSDRSEATSAESGLDLAALAERLRLDESDHVTSHVSPEHDHAQSRDTQEQRTHVSTREGNSESSKSSSSEWTSSEEETGSTYQLSAEAASQQPTASSISMADQDDSPAVLPNSAALQSDELVYRISPEDYRKAAIASPNTNAAFWSYRLYKNSKGQVPTIHYCTTFEQAETQAKHFLDQPVLGFDLEWEMYSWPGKASIKNCVSLIQIASADRIGLFQLALFKGETAEELLPPSLRAILESKDIAKTGVNVAGDAKRLQQCFDLNIGGYFELSHLYKVVSFSETSPNKVNKVLVKLATQVQEILLLPMYKGEVRTSAWSKRLKGDQLEYAASDAYAGFALYHALEARRKQMDPMPPRPAYWEENRPLVLSDGRKMVAKANVGKRKANVEGEKAVEDDDDECEEWFDAVEEIDDTSVGYAGVPLAGVHVVYPSLPPPQALDDPESTSSKRLVAEGQPASAGPSKAPPKRQPPPPSLPVALAEQWATTWRASLPAEYNLTVTFTKLRAYHLWHIQEFSCKDVASLLRDPPLSITTVVNYVLDAVKEENLPYVPDRAKEVLGILPENVRGRYYKILKQVNG